MKQVEVNRFNKLYERHLRLLKLQGKSQKTIDAYSRSVRRIRDHFFKIIKPALKQVSDPFMTNIVFEGIICPKPLHTFGQICPMRFKQ